MSTQTNPIPWKDDPEFLDQAIATLHARCRRLVAERQLQEAKREGLFDEGEAQQKAISARQVEDQSKAALEARFAVHRSQGSFRLGIDRLTSEADLGEQERALLLHAYVAAISEDTAAQVFEGLDFALYVSMTVEGICRVLEADTVADRLRVRRMLRTDGPLVRHGLVRLVGKHDEDIPQDLNGVDVKLTRRAFEVLSGTGS